MLLVPYRDHFLSLRKAYDQALSNHRFDKLIVHSGGIKKRFQDDMRYPYFVSVQFKALVPLIDAPESWIIWQPNEKPLLLLYQPEDYWHLVPKLPDSYWTPYFDIKTIKKHEDAQPYFGNTEHSAFLGESTDLIKHWRLGRHNPEPLLAELNWYRSYKTEYEQACIIEGNRISAKGHLASREVFYNGGTELDIALEFQKSCQQSEELLAYTSIVGINEHAGILHYWGRDTHRLPSEKRHSLLIDAAASCQGYAADITRTYSFKDDLFAELIMALDATQQSLVKQHQIGRSYTDVGLLALLGVSKILNEFGIVSLNPESCVETGVVNYFMPHRLGHFLGLQVHDVGGNQADLSGPQLAVGTKEVKSKMVRSIESNHMVTVEPGIYFIDSLLKRLLNSEHHRAVNWRLIEELRVFGGMRIEDNVLITDKGPVNLTRQVFAESGN